MIRFNTNDVLSFVPGTCLFGGTHRRLSRVFGRADNMVKLRGINVFPEAIGALLSEFAQSNGEYICILEREPYRLPTCVRALSILAPSRCP